MFQKLLLAVFAATAAAAHAAAPLPQACGNDDVKFSVKVTKAQQPAQTPGNAVAQIVFIETLHKTPNMLIHPTVRFGVDGTWVGAVKGSSYFTVPVQPGEHHLCAAWQSHFNVYKDQPGVMPLTVEAGKTYFVDYKVNLVFSDEGAQPVISFAQTNSDEAQFLITEYPLATWKKVP